TSGGDAPGMNAAVRAVVRSALEKGIEVVGIMRGYTGLLNHEVIPMDIGSVSDIIQRGGTILRTARCEEFRYQEGVAKGKDACEKIGINGLVVIGGDGSFRGAADLSAMGIPCVGVPGTIDNDISCTEYTIGYDTAMNTAMQMSDFLRDTAQSHERCMVIEVMGRHAGHIALNAGIACGATYIVVPEVEFDKEAMMKKIQKSYAAGKRQFLIFVAEGVGGVAELAKEIEETTGIESRSMVLGHVQRGGSPTVRDRVAGTQLGHYAVELLAKGIGNRVVGFQNGQLVNFDIQEALKMKKSLDMDLYRIANDVAF
ncbi:MAG TPA: 6-phosphofructokinase, partial [Firmicutes bacterium]|nr:6-phosphofructokinase [Bacillota bacterium]